MYGPYLLEPFDGDGTIRSNGGEACDWQKFPMRQITKVKSSSLTLAFHPVPFSFLLLSVYFNHVLQITINYMSMKRLLSAAASHVSFYKLETAAATQTQDTWKNIFSKLLSSDNDDKKSHLLRAEEDLNAKEGKEKLIDEMSYLIENLSEKRRLQLLDAGAESLLNPEQLTRLAARRVGLEVPENFGDVSAEATKASAQTLQSKLREKMEEVEAMGDSNTDEGKLREKRIRAIAEKAKNALASDLARHTTKKE